MSIQIELHGDKRPFRLLKYDIGAVRDLENALDGKPLASVIVDISRLGMNAMVAALWAGLKHEDPSLTQSLVAKMLDRHFTGQKNGRERLRALGTSIDKALEETGLFSTEEDEEKNEQPEPA